MFLEDIFGMLLLEYLFLLLVEPEPLENLKYISAFS